MAFAFFVISLLFLGIWYLMKNHISYDKIAKPWIVLGLKGLAGASFTAFICILLAMIVSYNPWIRLPDASAAVSFVSWEDSRPYLCIVLSLAFLMIGLPIGFLLAISRSSKELEALQK